MALALLPLVGANGVGNMLAVHNQTALAQDVHGAGFGTDVMSRVFTRYHDLPVGEAKLVSGGWHKGAACIVPIGYPWTRDASGATIGEPLTMYTNAAGQPSGVGAMMSKYLPPDQRKYAKDLGGGSWQIDVGFRSGDQCENVLRTEEIGDQLVVNPGGASTKTIPLTADEAVTQNWQKGSCFNGMGWHYFFNTAGGTLPMAGNFWNKGDVFPVVAMYHQGQINAIFFASVRDQFTYKWGCGGCKDTNFWEPSTLNQFMMCKNMCHPKDSDCGFERAGSIENSEWSTMHIYFRDTAGIGCGEGANCFVPGAGMGCCGGSDSDRRPPPTVTSNTSPFPAVIGGLGLLAGVLVTFVVVRKRDGAREVQMSEMASTAH